MGFFTGTSGNNWIYGTSQNDIVYGLGGHDRIYGGYGDDTLSGGAGVDTVHGGWGDDLLIVEGAQLADGEPYVGEGVEDYRGGTGDDRILILDLGNMHTQVRGDSGYDLLDFSWFHSSVFLAGSHYQGPGSLDYSGIEHVRGSSFDDVLIADWSVDRIEGQAGNDIIMGRLKTDTLSGGAGNDTLSGGPGDDVMTGDGGADIFEFLENDDAPRGNDRWATITDFNSTEGDRIDLSQLGTLHFVGERDFGYSLTGQVRIERDWWSTSRATLEIDLNGDRIADGHVDIFIEGGGPITADDLIL
ncbi:Poly(beta-D-mannuronate) C5 epimerase 1 [Roseovarius sp. THAF9]|uniref:calcium-binding protein n=1 Tax=Roseovarius sp. THAF9 TaxID=2587847 RepID=UPI0012696D2E|nr:hypothetical protein [Roseovarius sp. THAF9]QFT93296.1 Poly(beta-D-mannuronate) C5 epimerase 1 [Roseovarius sp. THAF9]